MEDADDLTSRDVPACHDCHGGGDCKVTLYVCRVLATPWWQFNRQVLNFVRVAVQARKVNLLSIDEDVGETQTLNIPLDSSLQEVTVSVSGENPKIILRDPAGQHGVALSSVVTVAFEISWLFFSVAPELLLHCCFFLML